MKQKLETNHNNSLEICDSNFDEDLSFNIIVTKSAKHCDLVCNRKYRMTDAASRGKRKREKQTIWK